MKENDKVIDLFAADSLPDGFSEVQEDEISEEEKAYREQRAKRLHEETEAMKKEFEELGIDFNEDIGINGNRPILERAKQIQEKIDEVTEAIDNDEVDIPTVAELIEVKDYEKKLEAIKKANMPKPTNSSAVDSADDNTLYKYPFTLHFAGKNIEIDHIFHIDKEYKAEEIRAKMLDHQYYEFAGKVKFDYIQKENVLIPIFQQHKKG